MTGLHSGHGMCGGTKTTCIHYCARTPYSKPTSSFKYSGHINLSGGSRGLQSNPNTLLTAAALTIAADANTNMNMKFSVNETSSGFGLKKHLSRHQDRGNKIKAKMIKCSPSIQISTAAFIH